MYSHISHTPRHGCRMADRLYSWLQEQARANEAALRWQNTPEEYKAKVKQDVLTALASQTSRVGAVAAQVLAAIAAIELPNQQWPELVNLLLSFVNNAQNVNLRIATLQAIGYICETIVGTPILPPCASLCAKELRQAPEILKLRANEILTAVVQGARREEPSTDVQLAAIKALYNSLDFIKDNFEREVRHILPSPKPFSLLPGRAKLHHASRVRSHTKPSCRSAGCCF
jgi:importin subunit beta-1